MNRSSHRRLSQTLLAVALSLVCSAATLSGTLALFALHTPHA